MWQRTRSDRRPYFITHRINQAQSVYKCQGGTEVQAGPDSCTPTSIRDEAQPDGVDLSLGYRHVWIRILS